MPVTLYEGDCLDILKSLPEQSVHSVVTDPPYGLSFMGKKWDYDVPSADVWCEVLRVLKPGGHLLSFAGTRTYHRMVVAIEDAGFEIRDQIGWLYGTGFPKGHNALKPAWEPIVLARKPLIGTVVTNVIAYGTGTMNIDACRIPTDDDVVLTFDRIAGKRSREQYRTGTVSDARPSDSGRWPANVIHDGSDEVMDSFAVYGESNSIGGSRGGNRNLSFGMNAQPEVKPGFGDTGLRSRFFYCAKASKAERAGSIHPTVKPISLMRYLCKLVTPTGGTVLDPFAGTGTTGQAAVEEGFSAILIEREAAYCKDIRRRLALYLANQATGREPLIQLIVAEPVLSG